MDLYNRIDKPFKSKETTSVKIYIFFNYRSKNRIFFNYRIAFLNFSYMRRENREYAILFHSSEVFFSVSCTAHNTSIICKLIYIHSMFHFHSKFTVFLIICTLYIPFYTVYIFFIVYISIKCIFVQSPLKIFLL